jgi:hypothetical protein
MVRRASRAAAASFLLLFSPLLCAQSSPPKHPPRPKVVGPAKWEPSSQELSAAYWTLEPGWNTDVEMRNNLISRELTITPVLRSALGQETSLAPVTVAAQHIVSLDLGLTSVQSCVAQATQTYSCNGSTVGTFTLTNTYVKGTLNGQAVTNVSTTKQ